MWQHSGQQGGRGTSIGAGVRARCCFGCKNGGSNREGIGEARGQPPISSGRVEIRWAESERTAVAGRVGCAVTRVKGWDGIG